MKRVVITGMGGVTAFGNGWDEIEARLEKSGRNAVRRMPEWDYFELLHTRLACPLPPSPRPRITRARKRVRWDPSPCIRCAQANWR